MKHTVIKEKKAKAARYDWRKQKEMMLGLDDKRHGRLMAKIMQEKDAELQAAERENSRLGYCPACGTANTMSKICMKGCEPPKGSLTRDDWFMLGVRFSYIRIMNVVKDCSLTG
jgi:hypothetical protein